MRAKHIGPGGRRLAAKAGAKNLSGWKICYNSACIADMSLILGWKLDFND